MWSGRPGLVVRLPPSGAEGTGHHHLVAVGAAIFEGMTGVWWFSNDTDILGIWDPRVCDPVSVLGFVRERIQRRVGIKFKVKDWLTGWKRGKRLVRRSRGLRDVWVSGKGLSEKESRGKVPVTQEPTDTHFLSTYPLSGQVPGGALHRRARHRIPKKLTQDYPADLDPVLGSSKGPLSPLVVGPLGERGNKESLKAAGLAPTATTLPLLSGLSQSFALGSAAARLWLGPTREDEDYVPSGRERSEDDVNESVKDDEVDGEEQTQKTKGEKERLRACLPGGENRWPLTEEEEEEGVSGESGGSSREEEDTAAGQEEGTRSEDARKKEDELWASFLNDVGPNQKCLEPWPVKAEELEKSKERGKVKITKVFDFAGEEVRVTEEVDATSKEAKSFFKQNEKEKPQTNVPSTLASLPAGSGLKRSSGMSSLWGNWSQVQKTHPREVRVALGELPEEESTGEEPASTVGKEGHIERKAFLDRADHRQFETERDLGLSTMKP
ncbi:hypothetical protein QTO34_004224 [Cnephaeus nilssonii]|uniref:Craniofacial development protein 1 n=1 Tax=Cnephaeus nilssonii TaxID=3371016 RepID=A0AA40HT52_CNENI|nr:hypothetical protein QTO34_004224 [Eptesicus nilssonii]